jgi:uncharacterized membrane protein
MDLFKNLQSIDAVFFARSLPDTAVWGIFLAIIFWVFFLYRRRLGALPSWVRGVLAFSRLMAMVLVAMVFLEPTAKVTQTHTEKRRLPVLVDVSGSMSVKDQRKRSGDIAAAATALGILPLELDEEERRQGAMSLNATQRQAITNASRLDLATNLLSKPAAGTLDALSGGLDVRYYAFAQDLHPLGNIRDGLSSLAAKGEGTALAKNLESLANSGRGSPLAGIVVLSDGLDPSSGQVESVAMDLGIRGIPVYTVPVGIDDPDDISVRNVVMQEVAFSGDKVPVRVQIFSKGYEKRTTDLSVFLDGRGVARTNITLQGGLQFEEVFFNVDVREKGAAKVEVSLEPFTDEATAENNRLERSVRVVNEKINVLCIEGSARWEFRYLRAMLKRDPRIHATFIATRASPELARNSSEYIASFPEEKDEAFSYDLIILGDVNSTFFSTEAFQRLEELVKDRGGSLLMLCGARYSPASYAGTLLEPMLPVAFDPSGEWEDVDENVYPVLTPEGRSSLVMTLESGQEENDLVWSRVAPLDRLPPLLEPRPGATVLAELSDTLTRNERYPLVSWQRYGTGKCMMMATDRLWLLRFKTGDKYHWRVWSQCVQFLTLSRLMGEHKRIRLETDRATYPEGGQAMLYAHLLDEDFEPMSLPGFEVDVRALDAGNTELPPTKVTLRPDASKPGLYEGYFTPPAPGSYRLGAIGDDQSNANTTDFQVADTNTEMARTEMQIETLRRISELSGGKTLSFSEFKALPALIDHEPHITKVQTEKPLWDNGIIAFLLVGFLGLEWILRRKYDLP